MALGWGLASSLRNNDGAFSVFLSSRHEYFEYREFISELNGTVLILSGVSELPRSTCTFTAFLFCLTFLSRIINHTIIRDYVISIFLPCKKWHPAVAE